MNINLHDFLCYIKELTNVKTLIIDDSKRIISLDYARELLEVFSMLPNWNIDISNEQILKQFLKKYGFNNKKRDIKYFKSLCDKMMKGYFESSNIEMSIFWRKIKDQLEEF